MMIPIDPEGHDRYRLEREEYRRRAGLDGYAMVQLPGAQVAQAWVRAASPRNGLAGALR